MESITKNLATVKLDKKPSIIWADDAAAISRLVDAIEHGQQDAPSIFVDLEGVNLSRQGTISIMQIYDAIEGCTYLIDVHTLGKKCFLTPNEHGRTLKNILEDKDTIKIFFDVRNDSDALYAHYGIALEGIHDLQLMELATRSFSKQYIKGLSKCIERDAPLSIRERSDWIITKEKGVCLFAPEKGGSYEVFNKRPVPENIRLYCAQDVQFLPRLYKYYKAKMTSTWHARMVSASKDRVSMSQSATYNGKGKDKARAPDGWYETLFTSRGHY
ncbi:3' 5' exonuclease [Fusarium heterosporum]|uniref:3' 5' exonuclease n=1 Tax=Fusarium heterosporum TaxID=42747 RepID=A0A8H5WUB2_FUSHE|nr:3' 5' exonuclease [Fusarium heterosporum]